jgi:hypothetical protein
MRRKERRKKQDNTKTNCEGYALFVNEQFGRQLKKWTSGGSLQD